MNETLSIVGALLGNRPLFHPEVYGTAALHRVIRFSGHEGISTLFEIEAAGPQCVG